MNGIFSEFLNGTINGVNQTFTFNQIPNTILNIYSDGVDVYSTDYTVVGNTLTFVGVVPLSSVKAVYIVGQGQALNNTQLFIPNEVPTGVINGVNKSFTCVNNIEQIITLIKDGAEYSDYTISGNTITFSVAPTYNVLVDYISSYSGIDGVDLSGNSSQSEILTRVYDHVIKDKTSSTVFDIVYAKQLINETQRALLDGDYFDLTNKRHRATKFSFLYKKQYFELNDNFKELSKDSLIYENIETQTNLYSSGYLYAGGDVIKYTNNFNGVFSGLTMRNVNLKKGTTTYQLFKLDTLNYKTVEVRLDDKTTLEYIDEISYGKNKIGYTIINDYYNNKYLMLIGVNKGNIVLTYQREVPDITSYVNSIMPKDYGIRIIPYIVAGIMLSHPGDNQQAVSEEMKGLRAYEQLKLNYAKDFKQLNFKIGSESNQPITYTVGMYGDRNFRNNIY